MRRKKYFLLFIKKVY